MTEKSKQYQSSYEDWLKQAKDYPTKALLYCAMELFKEQEEQIQLHQSKLDGISWSRESWID